jgi:predicted amidophosphoribosyltransferase
LEAGTAGALPVVAAARTHPDLVRLVGRFKYHGCRGLAWPLTRLLQRAYIAGRNHYGPVEAAVPVALHRRRQRKRGFNQAEILCRSLGKLEGLPVMSGVLNRKRGTDQQAKLKTTDLRRHNLSGAFCARGPDEGSPGTSGRVPRVCLVDDLITSGWTVRSAAEALHAAGWTVAWVLALGLSAEIKKPGRQVDTVDGGF